MYLFEMEGDAQRAARLENIVERVLHRLGDSDEKIWTTEEVRSYVQRAGRELVTQVGIIWDQAFLECLPPGFSFTYEWEADYSVFDYGLASYTAEGDVSFIQALGLEPDDVDRGNHTSPSDLLYLEDVHASIEQRALEFLPETLIDLERATYDQRMVVAANHGRVSRRDSRYQFIQGEVIAYTVEREGVDVLRKIRVPADPATIYEVDGSWGIAREVNDVTRDKLNQTSVWGVPRRVAGHHPIGDTEGWGLPRRFYSEDNNFKIEYWREPRVEDTVSELPDRYFWYLADYAQWKALFRNGPGQNFKMGQLYKDRWDRGIARLKNRLGRVMKERIRRLGGESRNMREGPPRPRLPWQYGDRVR